MRSSRTQRRSPACIPPPPRSPTIARSRMALRTTCAPPAEQFVLGSEVTGIRGVERGERASRRRRRVQFDHLVICAGLQSDRMARMAGDDREPTIVPFRGEYYRLSPERERLVRGLLYPVPDPHTRSSACISRAVSTAASMSGRTRCSRSHVRATAAATCASAISPRRSARAASARSRAGTGEWALHELRGSLLRSAFAAEARRYVPEVSAGDLVPAAAGIRAQALERDGSLARRLPHQPHRAGHRGAQRTVPRCDVEHGDRRAHRGASTGRLRRQPVSTSSCVNAQCAT